ncbi:MAG: DNA adenine methylase [Betaproteobacteria bacterium]|nr:DNA adenine methylase [Betaproteobacteria bacterium]
MQKSSLRETTTKNDKTDTSDNQTQHKPGNAFLAWIGGKSLLTDQILAIAPEHTCYVEVFAGAAWMLFRKEPSKVEVINDINVDLVTLYRVVQNHMDEFVRYFRWLLVSREEFERFKAMNPATMTDIQRAARFYYLAKTAFGARIKSPSFGTSTSGAPRLNLLRIEEDLSTAHLRLSRVVVENKPYAEIIAQYDRPHTWFYLDPPYFNCENYYGDGIFSRDDFARLADQLANIKGKFTLSINDTPEIRQIFKAFYVKTVKTRYSVASGSSAKAGRDKPVHELLFTNYDPTR